MNKLDVAKKIITETKLGLVKYVMEENISKAEKLSFMKFIKESSNYSVLHFAATGSFPVNKNTPIKSLLEQAVNVQSKVVLREDNENTIGELIDQYNEKIKSAFESSVMKIGDWGHAHPKTASTLNFVRHMLIISAIMYWSTKRDDAKAAKRIQQTDPAKAALIMKNSTKNARFAKINSLKKNVSTCSKAKDPQKCKQLILDKIKKEQAKIK